MAFVTRLTFTSGDRRALESAVGDVKAAARRKGVQFKGPHARPPETVRVPQYKTVAADDAFEDWEYAVYTREVEIVGHEEFVRGITDEGFPAGIHVSVEVEQVRGTG